MVVALGMAGIRDLLSYLRDNPLAGAPAPRKSVDLRHLAVGPSDPDHAAARPQRGRGRQAGLRRCLHPCRGRRQGRLRLPLRHADAAFQHARRPHLSDRFLSVRDRHGARPRHRRRRLRARSPARARRGAEAVLRQQLVGILEPRRFAHRHRPRWRARPAAGARGAHLPHRRRAALHRRVARARASSRTASTRSTITVACAR